MRIFISEQIMQMKNLLKIVFGGLTFLAFTGCGSSQVLDEEAPVTFDAVHAEPWTAGPDKKYKGVNLLFPVKAGVYIVLDSVYYKDQKAPLERIQKDNYLVYKATLEVSDAPYDLVMHADPKEEFGNRPPPLKKVPFELEDDEAVISYTRNGKVRYFKVSGIRPSPAIHYRERPGVKNRS